MPQGGIDDGETPEQALWRELYEETGVRQARLVTRLDRWLVYDLPTALVGTIWQGRYRGQRQQWFLLEHTGDESAIDIGGDSEGASGEFDGWCWMSSEDLLASVIEFKREVYQQVFEVFVPQVGGEL